MKPLPPVELPVEDSGECRALMVIVPVLTDPPRRGALVRFMSGTPNRARRRYFDGERFGFLMLKASLTPVCLTVLTVAGLWMVTSDRGMIQELFATSSSAVTAANANHDASTMVPAGSVALVDTPHSPSRIPDTVTASISTTESTEIDWRAVTTSVMGKTRSPLERCQGDGIPPVLCAIVP